MPLWSLHAFVWTKRLCSRFFCVFPLLLPFIRHQTGYGRSFAFITLLNIKQCGNETACVCVSMLLLCSLIPWKLVDVMIPIWKLNGHNFRNFHSKLFVTMPAFTLYLKMHSLLPFLCLLRLCMIFFRDNLSLKLLFGSFSSLKMNNSNDFFHLCHRVCVCVRNLCT